MVDVTPALPLAGLGMMQSRPGVRALQEWFLLGAPHLVVVLTAHRPAGT